MNIFMKINDKTYLSYLLGEKTKQKLYLRLMEYLLMNFFQDGN